MPSLAQVLARTASRVPQRIAVEFGSGSMTYAELDASVNQLARELTDRGLAKGDRLLLLSGNSGAFVVALYAGLRLGAIVVPVNPRSAPPEIDHFVTDSGASLLLFGPEVVENIQGLAGGGGRAGSIPALALGLPPLMLRFQLGCPLCLIGRTDRDRRSIDQPPCPCASHAAHALIKDRELGLF